MLKLINISGFMHYLFDDEDLILEIVKILRPY